MCALLWARVPHSYKNGRICADFWNAYQAVIPKGQHQATGKGTGQTCHIEQFNNKLRQRLACLVRKTLSFSKNDRMHEVCLLLFLHEYNRRIQRNLSN